MKHSPLPASSQLLRFGVIGVVVTGLAAGFAWTAGWVGPQRLSAQAFVDRFEENGGVHPGYRRAHAKGLCVSGWFESSGAAAGLSTAEVFQPGRLPVLGRLSIGSGSPHTPDIASPVRSLALLIEQSNGEQWRTAMNTPPVLPVGTPEAFFEQVKIVTREEPPAPPTAAAPTPVEPPAPVAPPVEVVPAPVEPAAVVEPSVAVEPPVAVAPVE